MSLWFIPGYLGTATEFGTVQTVTVTSTDHGNLAGLGDDDHTQYGALAQNETVAGSWTFSANVAAAAGVTFDGVDISGHAARHQHGGVDEVATATAAANAIPKAGAGGTLAAGWLQEVLVLADLSDVTATTGTGTTVVMQTSPALAGTVAGTYALGGTPTLASSLLISGTVDIGDATNKIRDFYGGTSVRIGTTPPAAGALRADGDVALSAASVARMGAQNRFRYLQSMARVRHTADQSIPNATVTELAFNTDAIDTDALHDPVTDNGRLTTQIAGKYLVGTSLIWAANGTGGRQVQLYKNGLAGSTLASVFDTGNAAGNEQHVSTLIDLAAGDYVVVGVYQNSGGALNVVGAGIYSPVFWMTYIGE